MKGDRWHRVEAIFDRAAQLEGDKRAAYLDQACAGDPELRPEVEQLLAFDSLEGHSLTNAVAGAAGEVLAPAAPAQTDIPADLTGKQIGPYQVTGRIGAGGMGVVYRARDTELDRTVAIKVLPPALVQDVHRRHRFIREAKAASALNHPNIVTIHAIMHAEGMDCMVMEFVAGKPLDQLIQKKGLGLRDALKYGVQIADALAAAHAAGIVHRDLKPANIMVTEKGLVKVLDFGLAKLREAAEGGGSAQAAAVKSQTTEGLILGTPAYMSPEQAEGKPVDARSDIFSFGSVLYEMATGNHPFRRDSSASTVAAILREDPKPASEFSDDTPRELERIISRCLQKDPDRRFQHMADVKVALEELKEESDSGARLHAATAVRRRRRMVWAVGALALTAALCFSVWLGFFRRPAAGPMMWESAITALGGAPWGPALSPDGKQVAFVWDGVKQDNHHIYVQLVSDANPRRLTSRPEFEYSPVWSPDALHIAFLRETADATDVVIIPTAGGVEQRVYTSRASCRMSIRSFCRQFYGIAWSPDGKYLAVVDKESPQAPNSIFLLDIESRKTRKLTTPPVGWSGDGLSVFSPDGRDLAFVRTPGGFMSDIYVLPLTGSGEAAAEPRPVTHDGNFIYGLDWAADGRSIIFASARGGVAALWRVASSGGEPERLRVGGNSANWPSVSRIGNRLAYSTQAGDRNIWRASLPGAGVTGDAGAPTLFIYSREEEFQPAFSPDGKKVAFSSNRSGNFEVWICGADGSSPTRLTYFNGGCGHPAWSPDGRQIAFKGGRKLREQNMIHIVSADGGTPRRITTGDVDETRASWSRDGQWVYISADRGTGSQIWKVPADGGTPLQLTRKGGFRPFVSVDGNSVYFLRGRSTGPSIWRMATDGGEETPVVELGARALWTVSESGIYVLDPDAKGGPAIELSRFDTRTRSPILKLPGERDDYHWGVGSFTVSPDERWVLYEHKDRRAADIMLVENFP